VVNHIEDNTLLIDIGNSSLKWAQSSSGVLSDMLQQQQQHSDNITSAFFTKYWQDLDKPGEIIASCVAQKSVWQALEKACDELWGIKVQKVNSLKEGFGLINAYDDALALGSDRWCAMIGGLQITDSAFIVIDAGSALTLDVVDISGSHLGGYIVPGLEMMRKSLGLHTAQVKTDATSANITSLSLASSTSQCVEAGIHLTTVKLIEAVYEKESKQLKKCQCLLTGGDAKILADLLSVKCVMMPDLVLRGLAVIAGVDLENNNN